MVTRDRSQGGVLALVPARGGSKSIPGKNLRPFGGHALLAWSIAAAREAACVDRVLVSTDDAAIRAEALRCGAEAPFVRPAALAQDDTPDLPVFAHALEWLERVDGWRPEIVVQLRPTSPVRPRGLVDEAVARLRGDADADSLRAVTPAAQNPFKMWRVCEDGAAPRLDPLLGIVPGIVPGIMPGIDGAEAYNMPRQALPATYWQTGHVDVMRRATVLAGSMTGRRIAPLVVPARFAVDIDTVEQWAHGEWVAERLAPELVRPDDVRRDLGRFRLLVLDFDGVLTDNRVHVDESGCEAVTCDRSDGLGLAALRRAGFPVAVLSTEVNAVVGARCRKLGLPYVQGLDDKAAALRRLVAEYGLALDDVIYVGNDVNDGECLRAAGLAVVPDDAHPAVRRSADWVLSHAGGRGAVRELCDALLEAIAT